MQFLLLHLLSCSGTCLSVEREAESEQGEGDLPKSRRRKCKEESRVMSSSLLRQAGSKMPSDVRDCEPERGGKQL